jgi:hypothetical protein
MDTIATLDDTIVPNDIAITSLDITINVDGLNITDTDDDEERICGICADYFNRDSEDYHKLNCGHEFHFKCISDCYCSNAAVSCVSSTNNKRECPYCRAIGPVLPIKMGIMPIKGVHKIVKMNISANTSHSKCLAVCKTKKKCKNSGKDEYNGYCGIHKNHVNHKH